MSGVVYYFSATGNSLYAAKVIAKKINAEVVQISYNTEKSCNQNIIGFVYPTFYWGLPEMVATLPLPLVFRVNLPLSVPTVTQPLPKVLSISL